MLATRRFPNLSKITGMDEGFGDHLLKVKNHLAFFPEETKIKMKVIKSPAGSPATI